MRRRMFGRVFATLGATAWIGTARAQGPHWLAGTWTGTITGLAQPQANDRTFKIAKVEADGRFQAMYSASSFKPYPVGGKVTGERVQITTQGLLFDLQRRGAVLDGTVQGQDSARQGRISLAKTG